MFAGLAEAPYHTNASLFNLTELPERMVVIGAGPVGLEMAQAFAAFGSQVTVLQRGVDILPKEDVDAANMIRNALEEDGVQFITGVTYKRVSVQLPIPASGHPQLTIEVDVGGNKQQLPCEVLLVAAGRRPNVSGLGLEAAGVEYDAKKGVYISDTLQTSNPNIFAVGDVCQPNFFTHVAGTMAMMTVQNALFGGDDGKLRRYSDLTIPRVTFTEPEVAAVGLCPAAGSEDFDTYSASLEHNDRCICESAPKGFVKIHCPKGSSKIVGATIVAPAAGEMISELTLAIQFNIPISIPGLGSVIHSYPTVSDAVGGAAHGYKVAHWAKFDSKTGEIIPAKGDWISKRKPRATAMGGLLAVGAIFVSAAMKIMRGHGA